MQAGYCQEILLQFSQKIANFWGIRSYRGDTNLTRILYGAKLRDSISRSARPLNLPLNKEAT